jgi:GNAT superfamily N-acetyltransferase
VTARFQVEVLGPGHRRSDFSCGNEALDRYLAHQAGQDARRRVSICYVAVDDASGRVAAYYTLAAGSVLLSGLPEDLARRLPRYPSVPIVRLGRLAVDRSFQGCKLGGSLLADAAVRALRSEIGVFALVVDAKDDAAAAFYRHHGFPDLLGNGKQMILALNGFSPAPRF